MDAVFLSLREKMLKPNHVKALSLLKDNLLSVKEVAKASNFSETHLYDLIEGNVSKAGNVAALFEKEYRKTMAEVSKRTQKAVKTLQDRLIDDLAKWNDSLPSDPKRLKLREISAKRAILAELNKFDSRIEIGEFHYHTGLSGEDLVNEFKRIKSLVEFAASGKRVSPARSRGAGKVLLGAERIPGGVEAEEASDVPAESETGEVSS